MLWSLTKYINDLLLRWRMILSKRYKDMAVYFVKKYYYHLYDARPSSYQWDSRKMDQLLKEVPNVNRMLTLESAFSLNPEPQKITSVLDSGASRRDGAPNPMYTQALDDTVRKLFGQFSPTVKRFQTYYN